MIRRLPTLLALLLGILPAPLALASVISNWWDDGANIVMDDILLPAATWSLPAQLQMVEWNEIDVTNNSHPFKISLSPEHSFGADDGDSTIGFLAESELNSEYGVSYSSALAWTICFTSPADGRLDECDVMFDPSRGWLLEPDERNWFQSTVLHELGHVRGLEHYNGFLSSQNSGTSKYLRGETLFRDDKAAVRQHASHVMERDLVIYNRWHDGSFPRWMTLGSTTLRVGETIEVHNLTVENRGSQDVDSAVRFGIYLSTDAAITPGDTLLSTGFFATFPRETYTTFSWSAEIPPVDDCSTYYIGGVIDDDDRWAERFEGNNSTVFTHGLPYTGSTFTPTPLKILLAEDGLEPNDSRGTASAIALPYLNEALSIDTDLESDHYRFVLDDHGLLDARVVFSQARGNIDLQLLDATGRILASSTSKSDNEAIFESLPPGTYYLHVYGAGQGSCNPYTLAVDLGLATAFFADDFESAGLSAWTRVSP